MFELVLSFGRWRALLTAGTLGVISFTPACSGRAFTEGEPCQRACAEADAAADEPQGGRAGGGGGPASAGSAGTQAGTSSSGVGGRAPAGAGGTGATPPRAPEPSAGPGSELVVDGLPPFPATEVLDDFNRIGAGIGDGWLGARAEFSLEGQALSCEFCGEPALWKEPFGARQEVFATYERFDADAMEMNLVLKSQGSPKCELIEVLYSPATGTARVATCARGEWVDSAEVPLKLRAGDQFGGRAHETGTIELFVNGQSIARIDASRFPYEGGHIGVNGLSGPSGNAWDDFGGGDW